MTIMKLLVVLSTAVLLAVLCNAAEEENGKKEVGTVIGIDLGTTYSW